MADDPNATSPAEPAAAVGAAPPFYKNDKYYRVFMIAVAAFVMVITPVQSAPSQLKFLVANAVFMVLWATTNLAHKMSDRARSTLPVGWPALSWWGDCNFFVWCMLAACTSASWLQSDEGKVVEAAFKLADKDWFTRAQAGTAFTFFMWFAQTAQLYFTRQAYNDRDLFAGV
jgi:hypothetical protein